LKSLYFRIWLTVVAALALFALVSGWMWQRHVAEERTRAAQAMQERLGAWAELVHRSIPSATAPADQQADALLDWSERLRVPLALHDAQGQRIAASDSFLQREGEGTASITSVRLDDGRTLWMARRMFRRGPPDDGLGAWLGWSSRPSAPAPHLGQGQARGPRLGESADGPWRRPDAPSLRFGPELDGPPPMGPPPLLFGLPRGLAPLVLVALLFVAVAAGAYPVVRRLTRRLEDLKQGVAAFGQGDLGLRVDASGHDEVAAVAQTFNRTAEHIEQLVQSHKRLLANASHELRSPLARLKMAVAMLGELPADQREKLVREIHTNISELDALVEEVLLASRLDGGAPLEQREAVDLVGVAAEEAVRVGADVQGDEAAAGGGACLVQGSERLLRRALRNLLENARRYGGDEVEVQVHRQPGAGGPPQVVVQVMDRGPGVPESYRNRIFEPYFRLPGHAERDGGVGLGLSLVRQIADAHAGQVRCDARPGGGSVFVLSLPAA